MGTSRRRAADGDATALIKHLDKQLRVHQGLEDRVVVRTHDLNATKERQQEPGADPSPTGTPANEAATHGTQDVTRRRFWKRPR